MGLTGTTLAPPGGRAPPPAREAVVLAPRVFEPRTRPSIDIHNQVMSIRVLVVDDDALLAAGLTSGLTLQGFDVVGCAHTAAAAMSLVSAARPDALLVDLDLGPGPTGIDVAHAAREIDERIGVTVLTSYAHPRLAGASSVLPPRAIYLVKSATDSMQLVAAAVRESCLLVALTMPDAGDPASRPEHPVGLSDTQMDVLRMLAAGMSNARIAEVRVVSDKAVEHAVRRLAKHFAIADTDGVNVRVALTRKYFELIGTRRVD